MGARSVRISPDEALLQRIDARKETKQGGRSAFIRRAIELSPELDRRRSIDEACARGHGGRTSAGPCSSCRGRPALSLLRTGVVAPVTSAIHGVPSEVRV